MRDLHGGTALLFDMDGTLVSTDHLHKLAFDTFFAQHDICLSDGDFEKNILGQSNRSIMGRYFPQHSESVWDAYAEDKEALFRELACGRVEPTLGAIEFVNECYASNIPMCVVTNAPRKNAAMLLDALGMLQAFEYLVIGDELTHGKPHPDPYLRGLEYLGVHPTGALAFEDSLTGIRSALSAGIDVVGISTSLDRSSLLDRGASLAIPDFLDSSLRDFLSFRLTATLQSQGA